MHTKILLAFGFALAGCGAPTDDGNRATDNGRGEAAAPALPDIKPGPNTLFVNVERVQRRTCPKITCGDVGWLAERQVVEALERRDGWVRITKLYDAACEGGISKYVDDGQASCSADNGIADGKMAEWVPESALSNERPADPAATATNDEAMVAQSDDFKRYRVMFTRVAKQLIAENRCTQADFVEQGGWMKSVIEYKGEPVYFAYCGGMTSANKIYMNAETGAVM